jgi:hypothetical protein
MKINPAIKGLITATMMIALSLTIFRLGKDANPQLQYFVYLVYALGIAWTVFAYQQSVSFTGKISDIFNQGFRCFIIVTFIMVLFTGFFIKTHPELAEQEKNATIEYYKKQGNKTPEEIEAEGKNAKNNYLIGFVSLAIPRYLLIGASVTVVLSLLLKRRN